MKKLLALLVVLMSFGGIINAGAPTGDKPVNYVALAEFTKNMLKNNKALQDAIVLAAREYIKANPMSEQQKIDAIKLITYAMDSFNEQRKYEGRQLSSAEMQELERLRANAQAVLEPFAREFFQAIGDWKAQQEIMPNFMMTLGRALYEALSK